jgi:hypothetical protein
MQKRIVLTDEIVKECLDHRPGDGMPLSYWSSAMPHYGDDLLGWDKYENDKFIEQQEEGSLFFCKVLNFVNRTKKLNEKRKLQPTYCLKVRNNPIPHFIYHGLLLD